LGILRLRWIEGRIDYGLGNVVSAEIAFFRRRTVTPAMIQSAVTQIWRKHLQVGPRHFL
jgi:hypothetical protein